MCLGGGDTGQDHRSRDKNPKGGGWHCSVPGEWLPNALRKNVVKIELDLGHNANILARERAILPWYQRESGSLCKLGRAITRPPIGFPAAPVSAFGAEPRTQPTLNVTR